LPNIFLTQSLPSTLIFHEGEVTITKHTYTTKHNFKPSSAKKSLFQTTPAQKHTHQGRTEAHPPGPHRSTPTTIAQKHTHQGHKEARSKRRGARKAPKHARRVPPPGRQSTPAEPAKQSKAKHTRRAYKAKQSTPAEPTKQSTPAEPTKQSTPAEPAKQSKVTVWLLSRYCLVTVWLLFGCCLVAVWLLFRCCLVGIWSQSGWYLLEVCLMFGQRLVLSHSLAGPTRLPVDRSLCFKWYVIKIRLFT
jgi:hypothetical protein